MPISAVYSITPVISVLSPVPALAGPSATAAVGTAQGPGGTGTTGPATPGSEVTGTVTFALASYATDSRGGPTATYPTTATMPATVTLKTRPTRAPESGTAEPVPRARMTFDIALAEDPNLALGAPLGTDDLCYWAGYTLVLLGPALPQGSAWLVVAELVT